MAHPQTSTVRYSRLVNQSPVFYGWIILLIGTFGTIMTTPGQTHAVSIFIEYFISDLGISRSLVSSLYTVGTLVGSFALPIVGRRIDKHGPRRMMLIITLLFGLACIYMGFVGNVIMLGLGFILIRMLGQGSLGLVSSNIINQWWVRRRGMVMGISGLLMSLISVGVIPSLLNWLIPIYGWRAMYMLMGLVLLLGLAPLVIFFVRDQPEQYGLHPDGDRSGGTNTASITAQNEISWTLQEAQRTWLFWIMGLGMATVALLVTGLMFHIVSIFRDNGLDESVAAWVYMPIAATTATVNLGSGILADRIPVRILLAIALFLQTIALFMAQHLTGTAMAFGYGVVLGSTMGLMGTVNSVGWAKCFGRAHLGSIAGMATTILIIGSSLGPMPFGVARDWFGSYHFVLTLFAFLPLGLGIASLLVRQPQK